jgi:hypothetical protein
MNMRQVRKKAEQMGIQPGEMKKKDLIHAVQRQEGYPACYGDFGDGCPYLDCCWRSDCRKEK